MHVAKRFLSICLFALLLGTQWVAHLHRVEHRVELAGLATADHLEHAQDRAEGLAAEWNHERFSAQCTLYDALTAGDAHHGELPPSLTFDASPTKGTPHRIEHAALQPQRACARGPPNLI
jgi:hypothetical protein